MVNQTVAARAAVAIFATMAASSLFVAGPMFDRLGPRLCVLLEGWAYPLHVGSLFYYNCTLWPGLIFQYTDRHIFAATGNATFVIASGAILGVGASLVWVAQGGVVTTYVPEARRGLAIAMFLFVLNIGGSIASLWDFLSSPHSTGTVSDNAHFWFLAVMCVGWMSGIWICPPSSLVGAGHLQQEARENRNWRQMLQSASQIMSNWQVLGMIPLFFCADMFYEYQKNVVNRWTFYQHSHTFTFRGTLLDRTDGRGNHHSRHPRLSWSQSSGASSSCMVVALRVRDHYLGWRTCIPKVVRPAFAARTEVLC